MAAERVNKLPETGNQRAGERGKGREIRMVATCGIDAGRERDRDGTRGR